MRAWRDVSVVTKVIVALFLIVLLFGLLAVGVQFHITNERDTAKAINEAGLQRFHLQKIMTNVERIKAGEISRRSELAKTATRYNQTLTALIEGDSYNGIPPSPPKARAQFESLRDEWRAFEDRLEVVQSEPPESTEFRQAILYLESNAPTLIQSTDRAVTELQRSSERRNRRLQQLLIGILLVSLIAIATTWYGLQRTVFRPLATLTNDAQKIAAGDLDHEITNRIAEDEVGRMTRAVREMKEQLSEALQEARNFQHAVEYAGLAIFLTDTEGVIQYVNPTFERITGYTTDEAIGETPRILQSGNQEDEFYAELWETIQDGKVWQEEIVDQRKSGELFIADQTIAPVRDEDDIISGYVSILRDVTKSKQNVQFRRALERVLRHNLRNEVNVIDGHARLLQDSINGDEEQESIKRILRSVDGLVSLTEKAQSISNLLERPGHEISDDDVLERIESYCKRTHPEAQIKLDHDVRETVTVDSRIELAVVELCDNAINHNDRSQPSITISVTRSESRSGWIDISVMDTGPGIPNEEQAVIEAQEETPLHHGSGLGLWLVHLAVTSVGGSVSFAQNQPRGTVATLSLPTSPEKSEVPDPDMGTTNDEPG